MQAANDSASIPSGSVDGSVKRRQSLSSVVGTFAAELRYCPKKLVLSRFTAARKSRDRDPNPSSSSKSLADIAARSKSLSHLPLTSTDEPLLTLVLASTLFLDTTISESGERLYVVDTKGARTNICREDPVQGIAHVGAITWMDDSTEDRPLGSKRSASIQMAHGRRYFVDDFLRRTKLTSSRIFNIPHYPQALKWKRSGGNYKLTVAKGKTTIALLEPATRPRIKVFDALYERDATRPQREHRGVPVLLLDYLIATALLVMADKDEWLAAASGTVSSASGYSAPHGIGAHGLIQRWRMEVQVEPLEAIESEMDSRPSTPTASSSSVIEIGQSNSTVDMSSDPGVDLARRLSSPQSQFSRNQHLVTTMSPASMTFSEHSNMRSPAISLPISTHPFASSSELVGDGDRDTISSPVTSPLASVLPPMLGVGVSLGEPSPTFSESERSAETSRSRRHSLTGDEPPGRFARQSLPSSPSTSRRRPSTAGAAPRNNSRPFRPLPRLPPQSSASPPVPVPSVPRDMVVGSSSTEGHVGARTPGSRVVSLSPVPASLDDGPRTIRRTTSEATLSAKSGLEASGSDFQPDSYGGGYATTITEHERDHSLLKIVHRRSIYKSPLVSESPSPVSVPSGHQAPMRTLSAPSVPSVIPRTAPLRIRYPRRDVHATSYDTVPSASTSSSSSHYQPHHRDSPGRINHAARPSVYARPSPDDGGGGMKVGEDGEGDGYECGAAPPAYDTIDFSHPPLKNTSFRGVGLG